jgi:two-component system, response regulator PdtaR
LDQLRILIVEDEPLLAMDLEFIALDCGCLVSGYASNAPDAITIANANSADLAIVDVNLDDGPTGIDVARHITQNTATTVVFATANVGLLPKDLADALGYIAKPYSAQCVTAVIGFVKQRLADSAFSGPCPACLKLNPTFRPR